MPNITGHNKVEIKMINFLALYLHVTDWQMIHHLKPSTQKWALVWLDNPQLPYTRKLEVIWDQIFSNLWTFWTTKIWPGRQWGSGKVKIWPKIAPILPQYCSVFWSSLTTTVDPSICQCWVDLKLNQIFVVQNGVYMCPAHSTTCFKFNQQLRGVF